MELSSKYSLFNFSATPTTDLLFNNVLFSNSHFIRQLLLFLKNDKYFLLWNIVIFFVWHMIHVAYAAVVKALFIKLTRKRKSICGDNTERLVETSWNLCFYGLSIPVGMLILEPGKSFEENLNTSRKNDDRLLKCPMQGNKLLVDTTLFIALITGFYIHCAFSAVNNSKRKWLDIFLKMFFCASLLIIFNIRDPQFVITLVTVIGLPRLIDQISKLLYNFSFTSSSHNLKSLSYIFLIVHSMTWIHIYLWILPRVLVSSKNQHLFENMVFSILLCVLYGLELLTCPIGRVLFSLFLNKTFGLEYYLYGKNLFVPRLSYRVKKEMMEANRKNVLKEASPSSNSMLNEKSANIYARSENTVALYQTIRCYMRMKRKLKAVRKRIEDRKNAEHQVKENIEEIMEDRKDAEHQVKEEAEEIMEDRKNAEHQIKENIEEIMEDRKDAEHQVKEEAEEMMEDRKNAEHQIKEEAEEIIDDRTDA